MNTFNMKKVWVFTWYMYYYVFYYFMMKILKYNLIDQIFFYYLYLFYINLSLKYIEWHKLFVFEPAKNQKIIYVIYNIVSFF